MRPRSVGGSLAPPLPRALAGAVCDAAPCSVGLGFPKWGCRSHYDGCRLPLLSVGFRLLRGLQGHRPRRCSARGGARFLLAGASCFAPPSGAFGVDNGLFIIALAIITIIDCTVVVRGVAGWLPRASVRFTP